MPTVVNYKDYIGAIQDFPIKGITYRDIQPLLANETVFRNAIKDMGNLIDKKPEYWIALESRGFLFASALSMIYGGGIRLIRKKGKLGNSQLVELIMDLSTVRIPLKWLVFLKKRGLKLSL